MPLLRAGFCSCTAGVTLVKAIHASGRINQFLLTRKERVALGTNFDVKLAVMRGAGFE